MLVSPCLVRADATAAWNSPVPSALVAALRDGGSPYVSALAWRYAAYVQHVAAAGQARHDVPLFVNARLDAILPDESGPSDAAVAGGQSPGVYPSGGPLPHVDVAWKLAAPLISFLAPDVYFGDFRIPFKAYADTNRTLFVPEMRADSHGVSHPPASGPSHCRRGAASEMSRAARTVAEGVREVSSGWAAWAGPASARTRRVGG
jgi:hypothetical protein